MKLENIEFLKKKLDIDIRYVTMLQLLKYRHSYLQWIARCIWVWKIWRLHFVNRFLFRKIYWFIFRIWLETLLVQFLYTSLFHRNKKNVNFFESSKTTLEFMSHLTSKVSLYFFRKVVFEVLTVCCMEKLKKITKRCLILINNNV